MMAYRNLQKRVFGSAILQLKQNRLTPSVRSGLPLSKSSVNFLHSNSERTSNKLTVPGASYDILIQNLRSATDSSDILYYVQQHHEIMNEDHVMQAVNSIFSLQKSANSSMTNKDVVRNKNFNLLCKAILSKARYLQLNDHLNVLKTLSLIGVPVTSKVTQVLLQLVAKQVNMLSLPQIVFVEFIIKDYESCPLVDALLIALPIVFEARLSQQLRELDAKQASDLFMYAVKKRLPNECIDTFIMFFNDRLEELDVDICRNLVKSLTEIKADSFPRRNLMQVCLDTIIDNVNQLNFYDLNYILARLHQRAGKQFYHEEFVNCCAKFVIDNKCGTEQATLVLRTCNRYLHLHKGLIDYIHQKVIEDPSQLQRWTVGMLLTFTESMAIADYRPEGFESYKDDLIQSINKYTNKIEIPWFKTALNLCTLDCWPEDFFNLIFEEKFLKRFLKRDYDEDGIEVLEVYQAVCTLCPSYSGNLPSDDLLKMLIEAQKKRTIDLDSPLLGAFQTGLSGRSYVCSSLFSKLGHFIDHVVVMRKGGYAAAINFEDDLSKTEINLEDLASRIPEDSNVITVLYLRPSKYTVNTERIIGQENLKMRVLEAMGYSVVQVTESVWNNLLDGEKIPYLMQELKNKSSDLEVPEAAIV
ncbi:hypothetical protein LSTR_LSTR007415 [Laodelphax striatellus]|uniref:RAP domain-containing protein n=1 Tax=Laodelphax striatellus TaxID=195883 RepID=A0A482XQ06_LAOST|nr:hypothetical protein LSTR_LSTR007415 [Laodelphax striatellus]